MEQTFSNINIKMETNDLHDQLTFPNFVGGEDFGAMIPNNDIFSPELLDGDDQMNGANKTDENDIIFVYMDIRDPIKTLKTLLEQKIGVSLQKYEVWLQNMQMLEPHKNLVDQCVKGEGLVQINAQVKMDGKRINIADVVKPTEEVLEEMNAVESDRIADVVEDANDGESNASDVANVNVNTLNNTETIKHTSSQEEYSPELINWVVDSNFKREQKQLRIPEDPNEWTKDHVKYWLQWAIKQFQMDFIKTIEWNMNGKGLCSMSMEEFQQKVPKDPGNKFWTHLELLRKCKFIAVNHSGNPNELYEETEEHDDGKEKQSIFKKNARAIGNRTIKTFKNMNNIATMGVESSPQGNRTGNNGQIQLWQFLLDILTDKEHREIIQWIDGGEGEFRLKQPEKVATLWGERKNKPTMNYEKLSRALRYYYDGDMISKVTGKRFVYKFVCDLTQLIGYSAQELSDLVNESANSTSYQQKF